MNRITDKDLQAVVDRINRIMKTPMQPYAKDASGKMRAQIGNYHLSHAYGGVCLHQMSNASGGVRSILHSGYVPKRELYNAMHAYIAGLEEKHD
jgi:hypothetical protein